MPAITLLAQYVRELREYRQTGRVSDPLPAWREMFAATNGASNDVTTFLLRLRQGRARYGATVGVLGPLSVAERRKIVRALRRDGYCIFPQRVPARLLDAIDAEALRRPAVL